MAAVPAEDLDVLTSILDRYDRRPERLIAILHGVQEHFRYLPAELLVHLARALHVPPARVYGVATFYADFALEPKGRHLIRVCNGTACHVKHSIPVLQALRERLGLDASHKTTRDLQFTIETVACLGACSRAPVVVIDGQVHGQMTPAKGLDAIEAIRTKEAHS